MTARPGEKDAGCIGAVVIGRNEGERLRRCLESLGGAGYAVYVDSGSTDHSLEIAGALKARIITLDQQKLFTAARARNEGFRRLLLDRPEISLVQFVDGDCAVSSEWLDSARRALVADPSVAVVCGRRREINPEASIYNRLCDMEWDTPVGEARACGGDALMRVEAFQSVGGFNPAVIAGEEPELCVRLRAKGWRILRIDHEMTLHDAAMVSFGQWWKRAKRAGHAYAEGAALHGRTPERHCVRDVRSILFWGALLPLVAVIAAWPTRGLSLALLLLIYIAQGMRIAMKQVRRGRSGSDARLYAVFTLLAKFPQLLGVAQYWCNRLSGRRSRIIEYKTSPAASEGSA